MYDDLDDLREIGTPKAAFALVPFLWHEDEDLASHAALNLARLLHQANIENALRDYPLTEEQKKVEWFEWVWEPFNQYEPIDSSLPVIAGRIAYLINQIAENEMRVMIKVEVISNLEPRIVIPLAIQFQHKWEWIIASVVKNTQQPQKVFIELESILENTDTYKPTLNNWKNIFRPLEYKFIKSWHFLAIILLAMPMIVIIFTGITIGITNGVVVTVDIINGFMVTTLNSATKAVISVGIVIVTFLFLISSLWMTKIIIFRIFRIFIIFIFIIFAYFFLRFIFSLIQTYLSFFSIGIGIVIVLIITLLYLMGRRKEHEARNPLHELLKPPKTSNSPTLKWWGLGWFRK